MVISRQRLTAPLTRGNVPEEHAAEFTNSLVEEFEREIEPLVAKTEIEETIARVIAPLVVAIEDLRQEVRETREQIRETRERVSGLEREIAEREARQARHLLVVSLSVVGVNFGMIATAVGIILGFN